MKITQDIIMKENNGKTGKVISAFLRTALSLALMVLMMSCSGDIIEQYKEQRDALNPEPVVDTSPPRIDSVNVIDKDSITVVFNEDLDRTVAEETGNYFIQGNNRVSVLEAVLGEDGKSVGLTLTTGVEFGMQHGKQYTLLVQKVKDLSENAILNALANFTGRGPVAAEVWRDGTQLPLESPYPAYNFGDVTFRVVISGFGTYDDPGTGSYLYSLDGEPFGSEIAVDQDISLAGLGEGLHTLKVVGKNPDTGEWQDLNLATETAFTVDTIPPEAVLSRTPENVSPSSEINVVVEGADVVSYRYRLNTEAWSGPIGVGSVISRDGLADGDYTLYVRGIDSAGNEQTDSTVYSWKTATTTPVPVLGNVPSRYTKNRSVSITVGGYNVNYYGYSLNDEEHSDSISVETPITIDNLSDGTYTLEVIGSTKANDPDSEGEPVIKTWTVDNVAPVCTISNLPEEISNSQAINISVSSDEGDVVSYRYRLDVDGNAGELSGVYPVSMALELTALPENDYTLRVMGIDAAGNMEDASMAALYSWTVDITPPRANLLNLPDEVNGIVTGISNSSDLNVGVNGTGSVAYRYLLDGGTWSSEIPVSQNIVVYNLSDGYHTLSVITRDEAGNWQRINDPTEHVWLVDTEPPVALLTDVPASVTNIQSADIAVGGVGVYKYRYRLKYGSNSWTDLSPEYEKTMTPRITLPKSNLFSPFNDFLIEGQYTIEVQAIDRAGNRQPLDELTSYSWTVNMTLPAAELQNKPALTTSANSASITVTNVVSYRYKFDNDFTFSSEITADGNPIVLGPLTEGPHTLSVIGKNSQGLWQNYEAATIYEWTIDWTPPMVALTNRPPSVTADQSANFTVSGIGVYAYRYALDPPDPNNMTFGSMVLIDNDNTINLVNLAAGQHTLYAIGRDEAGNWQSASNATMHTWQIDTSMPTAVFNPSYLPPAKTNTTSISVPVSGSGVQYFKYKIDGGDWSGELAAGTPVAKSNLVSGAHTISAIGKNSAGTWQATPTTYQWQIDLTPPSASDITWSGLPANPTLVTSVNVTIGGAGITHYRYKINTAGWSAETAVATPITESGLGDNIYTLYVVGRDEAGNWLADTGAKTYTWRVDTNNPLATISNPPDDPSNLRTASIAIGGLDIQHYKYRFDSGDWSSEWIEYTTPINLTSVQLTEGTHTLLVIGTKNMEYPDSDIFTQRTENATTYTWEVDVTPPEVELSNTPDSTTTDTFINIIVGGEDVIGYRFRLDDGDWEPAASDIYVNFPLKKSLAVGDHTLEFIGRDSAGNWQNATQATTHTWAIVPPPLLSPAASDQGDITVSSPMIFTWTKPAGTANVKVLLSSNSNFTTIIDPGDTTRLGSLDGYVVGNVNNCEIVIDNSTVQQYFLKVSVHDTAGSQATDPGWKDWGTPTDGISVVGGIKGKIKDAIGPNYIADATVAVRLDSGSQLVASTITDSNGDFLAGNLPIGQGIYKLEITKSGYINTTKGGLTVSRGGETDAGLMFLVPTGASSGRISGTTVDANTGFVLAGSEIWIRDWKDDATGPFTANSEGTFTTSTLEPGVYTISALRTGYYDLAVYNVVVHGNKAAGRLALCEYLVEPQVRFIYQWEDFPSDPDIFLAGPTSTSVTTDGNPSNRFCVRSEHKSFNESTGQYGGGIVDPGDWYGTSSTTSLVMDTVTGFGPESINLYRYGTAQYARGVYSFTVHRFAYNPRNTSGSSAEFTISGLNYYAHNNRLDGVCAVNRDYSSISVTITDGSNIVTPNSALNDALYYRYNFLVEDAGGHIPDNSYVMWYDRSISTNPFQLNEKTIGSGSINVSIKNRIEAYGIYPGVPVRGAGIPSGTYVIAVANNDNGEFSIWLADAPDTSGTSDVTFSPGWGRSSGLVRVYDSGGLVQEIYFPADYLGSNLNCWKVLKMDIQGNSRSKRRIIQINQFMQDDTRSKATMDW